MSFPALNALNKAFRIVRGAAGTPDDPTNIIPDDWYQTNIHQNPVPFAYNPRSAADSTDDDFQGYVRLNNNEPIGTTSPWAWRCIAHGNGSSSGFDGGSVLSKMLRRKGNAGKYVLKMEMTWVATIQSNAACNIAFRSKVFNTSSSLNDPDALCLRTSGSIYNLGTFEATSTVLSSLQWNTQGDEIYVFIDFDNEEIYVNVNGTSLGTAVDISSWGSGWVGTSGHLYGDTNDGFTMDFDPDLSGVVGFPNSTTASDWTGWGDWEQYQTEYTILGFPNEVDAVDGWRVFADLGAGSPYIGQAAETGGVDFEHQIISPSIAVPETAAYAFVGQAAHDVIPQLDAGVGQQTVGSLAEIRQNGSVITSCTIDLVAVAPSDYSGSGVAFEDFSLTEGDVVDVLVRATSGDYQSRKTITDFYLIGDFPSSNSEIVTNYSEYWKLNSLVPQVNGSNTLSVEGTTGFNAMQCGDGFTGFGDNDVAYLTDVEQFKTQEFTWSFYQRRRSGGNLGITTCPIGLYYRDTVTGLYYGWRILSQWDGTNYNFTYEEFDGTAAQLNDNETFTGTTEQNHTLDTIQHVLVTRNATSINLWVDGVLARTWATDGDIDYSNTELTLLGSRATGNSILSDHFGDIDELKYFDFDFSTDLIAEIYALPCALYAEAGPATVFGLNLTGDFEQYVALSIDGGTAPYSITTIRDPDFTSDSSEVLVDNTDPENPRFYAFDPGLVDGVFYTEQYRVTVTDDNSDSVVLYIPCYVSFGGGLSPP